MGTLARMFISLMLAALALVSIPALAADPTKKALGEACNSPSECESGDCSLTNPSDPNSGACACKATSCDASKAPKKRKAKVEAKEPQLAVLKDEASPNLALPEAVQPPPQPAACCPTQAPTVIHNYLNGAPGGGATVGTTNPPPLKEARCGPGCIAGWIIAGFFGTVGTAILTQCAAMDWECFGRTTTTTTYYDQYHPMPSASGR